jgi:hypothetical protein
MIMPMAQPRYFEVPREFVHLRGEGSEAHLPLTITQTLALAGASVPLRASCSMHSCTRTLIPPERLQQKQVENMEAYYRRNSVWGRMPDAPPVKRLFAIYGTSSCRFGLVVFCSRGGWSFHPTPGSCRRQLGHGDVLLLPTRPEGRTGVRPGRQGHGRLPGLHHA